MPSLWTHLDTQTPTRTEEVSSMCLTLLEQTQVEGSKDMSDLVLGMIIGGLIGVFGSAVTALIHGLYSLRSRREEILAQQQQQSVLIHHEKDSQVISRRIALRSKYLEPLNDSLSALYASIDNYEKKLLEVLTPYYSGSKKYEIKVSEINKKEFVRQLTTTDTEFDAIPAARDQFKGVPARVGDLDLVKKLNKQTKDLTEFYKAYNEMYYSLRNSKEEQDWVYDFTSTVKSMDNIRVGISNTYRRIESLLAGVEEDEQ